MDMEDDIEFLISALSKPHSSQALPCSGEKRQEMRDAFVALQQLLRNKPLQVRSIPRSTAGGEVSTLTTDSELDSIAMECSSTEHEAKTSVSLSSSESLNLECKETKFQMIRRRDMFNSTLFAQRRHTSTVSLKLVCHSSPHIPNSDTTITADGIRYSLTE
ncbi:uncharacterized protein LOC117584035 [Drosophila guanche]|uniref:Uncharacterized protein n=1 Tax=Drosophila guanche TaxID=7266 RepID=A0A3B0JHV3_DROGU|nr:uncharacterized protein LOC117584035 [Drosophila guanche]SPP81785.1 Hypothetical predicted protein [Drosophila guanche]